MVYLKNSTKLSLITFSATGIFYLPYFYLYGSKQLIMLPYLDFVKPGSIITPLLSSLYTPTTLDQSTGNIWKSLFFLSPFPFAEYTIISFLALIIIAASLLLWILRDSFSRLLLLLLSSSLGLVLVIELLFGAEILSWADGRAVNFIYLIFCLTIFYVLYKWRDSAVILASFSIIFWLNSIVVLTHSSENILEQNFKYTDLSVLISTTRNSLYRDNKEKKALIIGQHNIQLRHYQVQAATSFDFEFDYLVLSNDSLYLLEGESDLNLNDYDVILFLNYTSGVMNNIDQAFQLLGQNQQFRLILEGEGGGHWGPLDEFEYFILNRPYTL